MKKKKDNKIDMFPWGVTLAVLFLMIVGCTIGAGVERVRLEPKVLELERTLNQCNSYLETLLDEKLSQEITIEDTTINEEMGENNTLTVNEDLIAELTIRDIEIDPTLIVYCPLFEYKGESMEYLFNDYPVLVLCPIVEAEPLKYNTLLAKYGVCMEYESLKVGKC